MDHDKKKKAFFETDAVASTNVPVYALVVDNPARQPGWMSMIGHPLEFNE